MDDKNYLSPFSWRYGSPAMRRIWSEHNKRILWRQMWLALAEAQAEFGLVTPEQLADLQTHAEDIDLERALEIEKEIHHDLMAEIKTYAEQCPEGGGIIHLGATSVDIQDNTDALRLRQSLDLLLEKLAPLLSTFAELIETHAGRVTMAYTHIQPAEPTTLGYRLAFYAQDLFTDWVELAGLREGILSKGFRGAVGTSASYAELIGPEYLPKFEALLSQKLGLDFYPIVTQTYPRKQEYSILSALAGLGISLYKFAFDLRILQSPPFGELSEPFKEKQVGSSAMPFKRNPINAEKLDSLARALAQMPRLAWDNAAHSLLERTLDDSANRRTLLPEAFLICDELLKTTLKIVKDLKINQHAIERNLAIYGPFAATERLLMALVKAGADRQEMHERIRQHALEAWQTIQQGHPNPLLDLLSQDEKLTSLLSAEQIQDFMNAAHHTGDAEQRSSEFATRIKNHLNIQEK